MSRYRRQKGPKAFLDLHRLEEDRRIEMIGHTVMEHRQTAAVVTDADPGKRERYIAKLRERFPGIVVLKEFDGPTPGAVTVTLGPPDPENN